MADPTQYAAIKDIGDPGKARMMMFANGQPVHAPLNALTASSIHLATAKATPVDADEFGYRDSVTSNPVKATWANLKAAIWSALGALIASGTGKTTPVDGDMFAIADSAASNATKSLTWANLKTTMIAALGTAATQNTGTSGHNLPFLDGTNTWSGGQTWSATQHFFTGATVNIEIGASGTSNSPLIDWHSGATGVDYDFRMIASGGSGSVGGGTLTFTGATLALGSTALTGSSVNLTAWLARGAPVTKTADFTVATTENNLINNKSGSTCTVTLPTASSFTGREILIKTIQAQTVVSASSNVVPLAGGAAGTAILAATAGKWAKLVSNGTNWEIMAAA